MKNKTTFLFVLLYFIIFVVSNSILVSSNNDVELDSSSISYWLRHLVVVLVALYSLIKFKKKGTIIILNIIFFTLIYFICDQYILGFMTIALFLSSIVFGEGYEYLINNKNLLIILCVISLVPFFINFNDFFNNGFFSTKYGRDRMLLGYFHPKEAAQPFAVLLILFYISNEKFRSLTFFSGTLLLFFIGSKNSLLYFLLFIYFTYRSPFKTILLLMLFIFVIYFVYINLDNLKNLVDELSSDRISAWADVMKYKQNGASQFKADSFYVEIYVKGGIIALLVFIIWFLYFITFNRVHIGIYSSLSIGVSLICSQLVFSIFDSGITSTGNLIHVFSWSMYYKFSKKYI